LQLTIKVLTKFLTFIKSIFLPGGSQMNSFTKLTIGAVGMSIAASLALSAPVLAQGAEGGDAFNIQSGSSASQGLYGNSAQTPTGTQTGQMGTTLMNAPVLQGASNATIAPQGSQATFVTGVNTAGTVRVNNLANLEALLNIIANGMEILGIAWGGPTMIMGFMHMAAGTQDAMKRVMFGAAGVTGGLATPGAINWLVASARDANLFS
jgi:hypothetical protein